MVIPFLRTAWRDTLITFTQVLIVGTNRVCLFGLLMVLLLSLPTYAMAGCPPLRATESFFESLARHTPSSRAPTDAEILELLKKGAVTLPPLRVVPARGPVPLTVEVHWVAYPVDTPVQVEFDFDGDGVFELLGPKLDPQGGQLQDGRVTHSYQREGQFQVSMRVRDPQGYKGTHTTQLTVIPFATFDAELQGLWRELKTALRRGDVATALDCIHGSSRSRYQKSLPAMLKTGKPIGEILTDIQFVEFRGRAAEYQMVRMEEGKRLSYRVLFALDADGEWRLRSF